MAEVHLTPRREPARGVDPVRRGRVREGRVSGFIRLLRYARTGIYVRARGYDKMGCDIHLHVEAKINGRWEHYSEPDVDRNYELFSVMAGVRANQGGRQAIAQPRGLPEDISLVTRVAYAYDRDYSIHDESWLTGDEVTAIEDLRITHEYKPPFGYFFGNGMSSKEKDEWPDGVTDVRIVFWFDN